MTGERLNKYLARAGVAARRKIDDLILSGRVRVNGKVALLGQRVDLNEDLVEVDGVRVAAPTAERVVLAYYKPRGTVTTTQDDRGRRTIFSDLPKEPRLFSVGRLDKESEGLLLMTNDGDLALRLTHPRYGHEKVYRVWVSGLAERTPGQLTSSLSRPRHIEGRSRQLKRVTYLGHEGILRCFEVTICEGLKHIVRRLVDAAGLTTERLIRVSHGPIALGSLRPGEWRPLTSEELRTLEAERSVE